MNAVDLGESQCVKNGRLRESDDIEGRRCETPTGDGPRCAHCAPRSRN